MNRFFTWIPLLASVGSLEAFVPNEMETIVIRQRLEKLELPQNLPACVAVPEGGFVYYYHPIVAPWLEHPMTAQRIKEIRTTLAPHLQIPLTQEGFSMASTRKEENEVDESSYSAIWVRDCVWHYFGLKTYDRTSAKQLILSLLKFYASKEQRERFVSVILDPKIADPASNPLAHMAVPLIRFSRKTLSHHQIEGKDQEWNHLQFDSHGLFLLSFSDALTSHILSPKDLQEQDFVSLSLFPAFFRATQYWKAGDAGPWEEELLCNASSAGLIASGLKRMMEVIQDEPSLKNRLRSSVEHLHGSLPLKKKIHAALSPESIAELHQLGVERVENNLNLGGEAPALEPGKLDRKADAALYFLCLLEDGLYGNHPERMKQILNINSSLIGPYGVYRYKYDAYQALNYWITYDRSSKIGGPTTYDRSFLNRLHKGYEPHQQSYDAQWFFDSNIAHIYYNLVLLEKDTPVKEYYLRKGDHHLKRALGQLTGIDYYTSGGEKVAPLQLSESINTLRMANGDYLPMPSLICPLSWAVAAMHMALEASERAHVHLER